MCKTRIIQVPTSRVAVKIIQNNECQLPGNYYDYYCSHYFTNNIQVFSILHHKVMITNTKACWDSWVASEHTSK